MIKCRIAFLFVTVAAGLSCLASAQNSRIGQSSPASAADPKLKASIQPLTPRSAMAPSRKSSVGVPKSSTSGRDTNSELGHLERQSTKIVASKNGTTAASKANPVKHLVTSSGNDSGINASYQKPRVSRK